MSEENQSDLLTKIIKWGSAGFLGLATIGGGIFPFVGDSVKRALMDGFVAELDTVYHIKSVPDNILPLLINASEIKSQMDSVIGSHTNINEYQKGVNRLVMNTCQVVERDGLKFFNDTCNQTLWTIQKGYIYQAVRQGGDWYYFPFQWQIPKGGDNRIKIEK